MSYTITLALLYSLVAGVMNGSFALPTKHIKTWSFEHIWLNYAFWAFLILPWLTVFVLNPQMSHVYAGMSAKTWFILLVGGFLFGAGQVCFALALNFIGLALGFIINIGLGTALGVLLPLVILNPDKISSPAGVATLIGISFIIIGLLISYHAGSQRDKAKQVTQTISKGQIVKKSMYSLSVLLSILAGLFSAGQNYTFALTADMQQVALSAGADSLVASIIIWPPFLTCTFIFFAAYMFYKHHKNNSYGVYKASNVLINVFWGFVMGALWFGSLAVYSQASLLLGALGPIIAWPLFMALIILTSNFWGWRHKEWQDCGQAIQRNALLSVILLVVAVLVLAYSAYLSHLGV